MKPLISLLLIVISYSSYSQKTYVCTGASIALNTPINDISNLIGLSIEIGKYKNGVAYGINTSLSTIDSRSIFQDIRATIPISNSPISITGAIGYFYIYKKPTIETSINFTIIISKYNSAIASFGLQSFNGSVSSSVSIAFNKDYY